MSETPNKGIVAPYRILGLNQIKNKSRNSPKAKQPGNKNKTHCQEGQDFRNIINHSSHLVPDLKFQLISTAKSNFINLNHVFTLHACEELHSSHTLHGAFCVEIMKESIVRTELVIIALFAVMAFSLSGKNITETRTEQASQTKERIFKASTHSGFDQSGQVIKAANADKKSNKS